MKAIMMREALETGRVVAVGVAGTGASLKLADLSHLASIGVAIATIVYIAVKTYFLIKRDGK